MITERSLFALKGRGATRIEPGTEALQISEKVYLVDSSCFLVSAKPSFYPMFGRLCPMLDPHWWIAAFDNHSNTRHLFEVATLIEDRFGRDPSVTLNARQDVVRER